MDPLQQLAEERVREAVAAGAFRDLPGLGRPLALDDLSRVPAELRAGYLLLRGAGYLPEEMEAKKELLRLGDLLAACADPDEAERLERRRSLVALRYELLMERRRRTAANGEYAARIHRRLGG